jgi:hypothetical protein
MFGAAVFGLLLGWAGITGAQAQVPGALCGVVDDIDYPINIDDTLEERYDDFGVYRARFGGNHVGLDIGFNRWGDPVYAAARGRVTYSDIEGWDTEKGVVIVEHFFPDGSQAYTLYGHMEQTDTIFFPTVGECVEKGDVIGAIGWPSRGLPHLHYEIRDFLPNDGGPGYVTGNPLLEGWFHPLDFTQLWRLRLSGGFVGVQTFSDVPSLPPVLLDSGVTVIASGSSVQGYWSSGQALWRITTDGIVTGLTGLPGDRVVAHTRTGQAMTLMGGRYLAVWTVPALDMPFEVVGETIVFPTEGGGLVGYDVGGAALWSLPSGDPAAQVVSFESSGGQIALGLSGPDGYSVRLVNADGALVYETQLDREPSLLPVKDDHWLALEGAHLVEIVSGAARRLATISPAPRRTARMTTDTVGNVYLYLGDPESTLVSLGASGEERWRVQHAQPAGSLAPWMETGNGCLLYLLDSDGAVNIYNSADGSLLHQTSVYAGGRRSSSPRARLLDANAAEQLVIGSGFLSLVTLDAAALVDGALDRCLLG